MDKPTRILVSLYVGGIGFFLFFILFALVNPWFGLGILASMGLLTYTYELITKDKWNDGICEKYEEPWEFVESSMNSDESCSYEFRCRDVVLVLDSHLMGQVEKQYKGNKPIK